MTIFIFYFVIWQKWFVIGQKLSICVDRQSPPPNLIHHHTDQHKISLNHHHHTASVSVIQYVLLISVWVSRLAAIANRTGRHVYVCMMGLV